jgi:hypothetical protein
MSSMRYNPKQILNLLRKIEVEIAKGKKAAQAARVDVGPSMTEERVRLEQRSVLI